MVGKKLTLQRDCGVSGRYQAWLLKNSFLGISRMKFVCKLNVRSPWTAKFGEITALVPFSTATGD
jgi:hypothetical protein